MPSWFESCLLTCALVLAAPAAGSERVRIGGSGVGLGGLRTLANAYQQQHPDCSILILPSIGSSGGIKAVIDGKLDLACAARPLLKEERGFGLDELPWATTPFVFATHLSTPPEDLTLAVVEDLYSGRRTAWKDGLPVRLVLRPKSDSSFAYLSGFTPGMRAALDHAHLRPGVSIGVTEQEALANLEKTPGSFGAGALGPIVSEGRKVQSFTVGGLRPTDPKYPFTLTLILVHRPGAVPPATRSFLEFIRSKQGQRVLVQAGYRPLQAAGPESGR